MVVPVQVFRVHLPHEIKQTTLREPPAGAICRMGVPTGAHQHAHLPGSQPPEFRVSGLWPYSSHTRYVNCEFSAMHRQKVY